MRAVISNTRTCERGCAGIENYLKTITYNRGAHGLRALHFAGHVQTQCPTFLFAQYQSIEHAVKWLLPCRKVHLTFVDILRRRAARAGAAMLSAIRIRARCIRQLID